MIDLAVEIPMAPKGAQRPRGRVMYPKSSKPEGRQGLAQRVRAMERQLGLGHAVSRGVDYLEKTVQEHRNRPKPIVSIYTPTETKIFRERLAHHLSDYMPAEIIQGALRVDWLAVLKRPGRLRRRKDPAGLVWAPVKPDRDNIDKNILDALNRFIADDCRVCLGTLGCCYAPKGGEPCIVVRIRSAAAFDPHRVFGALGLLPSSCTDAGSQPRLAFVEGVKP